MSKATKEAINVMIFMTLLMITYQNCGVAESLHKDLNCAVLAKDCKVREDELTRYQNEQEAVLGEMDQQIKDLTELLSIDRMEIEEVIDLCGNGKEILIRLDGMLIAYHNRRGGYLDVLEMGRYITTDGQACKFEVTRDMEIIYL